AALARAHSIVRRVAFLPGLIHHPVTATLAGDGGSRWCSAGGRRTRLGRGPRRVAGRCRGSWRAGSDGGSGRPNDFVDGNRVVVVGVASRAVAHVLVPEGDVHQGDQIGDRHGAVTAAVART